MEVKTRPPERVTRTSEMASPLLYSQGTHDHFSLRLRIVRNIMHCMPTANDWTKTFITDCADTRIIRTPSRQELLYTRSKIVAAARAFGLDTIDMVSCSFTFRVGAEPNSVGVL